MNIPGMPTLPVPLPGGLQPIPMPTLPRPSVPAPSIPGLDGVPSPAPIQVAPSIGIGAIPTPSTPGGGAPQIPSLPSALAGVGTFAKWLVAIALLWFVLTAMHEYGGAASDMGTGFALLVLTAAVLRLGPAAVQNAQSLFN